MVLFNCNKFLKSIHLLKNIKLFSKLNNLLTNLINNLFKISKYMIIILIKNKSKSKLN